MTAARFTLRTLRYLFEYIFSYKNSYKTIHLDEFNLVEKFGTKQIIR